MKKSIDNYNIETRIEEIKGINLLHGEFGSNSFPAIERYYVQNGYITGVDRLLKLIRENKFNKNALFSNPREFIRDFLIGYFHDRGGNQPEIWIDKNIVFLKTEFCRTCLTIEAEKVEKPVYHDICTIYCRAFAKGLVSVFELLYPGLKINFYNVSSRRDGKESDCVEAFQVIIP